MHDTDQSELYKFGNLNCIKLDQLGNSTGTFSIKGSLPSEAHSQFPPEFAILFCKLFHLNTVSFFSEDSPFLKCLLFGTSLGILVYKSLKCKGAM